MDPSALIFVALAVAWAVYLIPKALEHHEEGARTRTVERFSATMRVLGRREPISRRKARLVTPGPDAASTAAPTTANTASRRTPVAQPIALTPTQLRARRVAAARAAKRRLRVVTLILLANAVVAALAAFHVVAWPWVAVPVGVLAVWLVACRLMVRRERADLPALRIPGGPAPELPGESTEDIEAVDAELVEEVVAAPDPDSWDPVPVTLPTYVSKPAAPRSVSTIDLDSTGVWSSGHAASDSAIAREAEAAERVAKAARTARRASGS